MGCLAAAAEDGVELDLLAADLADGVAEAERRLRLLIDKINAFGGGRQRFVKQRERIIDKAA